MKQKNFELNASTLEIQDKIVRFSNKRQKDKYAILFLKLKFREPTKIVSLIHISKYIQDESKVFI